MNARDAETVLEMPRDESVDELSLLLPSWQIQALAEAAEAEGLTVAQYLRRLVSKALVNGARC